MTVDDAEVFRVEVRGAAPGREITILPAVLNIARPPKATAPPSRGRALEREADDSGDDLRTLNRRGREHQLRRLEERGARGMMGGMPGLMGGDSVRRSS